MNERLVVSVVVAVVFCALSAHAGEFAGAPKFSTETVPCDQPYYKPHEICRRLEVTFAYSHKGMGWEVTKGLITDGATIPVWARGLIGEPFAEGFAKAATLHDHYVRPEHQVRDFLTTHRMFYDALIDSGIGGLKAGVMYAAVVAGGPKWSINVPGDACALIDGDTCLKADPNLYFDESGITSSNLIEAKYDDLPMAELMREFETAIAADDLGPEQIQAMALNRRTELGYGVPSLRATSE